MRRAGTSFRWRAATIVGLILSVLPVTASAIDPVAAEEQWKALQSAGYGPAVAVPADGIVIRRDAGSFTLASGAIRLMAPVGGAVHGLVFEGSGSLLVEVPDPRELRQLRRFMKDPEITALETPFTKLYMRSSEDLASRVGIDVAGAASASDVAKKRQEHWVSNEWLDADARIVAAALNGGALWERIDAETPRSSWLSLTFDSRADEELAVTSFGEGFTESWLSMRRTERRDTPSPWRGEIDIEHVGIRADLTKKGKGQAVGAMRERPTDALLTVDVRFRALRDGLRALTFALDPAARDIVVTTEEREALATIRDHLGARTRWIDRKHHDPLLTVVLDETLREGETRTLRFEYQLEIPTFAIGNRWYPTGAGDWNDSYTASMELTVPPKHDLRSMGTLTGTSEAGGNTTSTFDISRPVTMLTFCIASRFDTRTIEIDGLPPVHSFGPTIGLGNRNQVRNVGVDVANAIRFFSWLFDSPLEDADMQVTAIPSAHGQAFDGFLHLSEATFRTDVAGASELFRAHEVAHQWWGHRVGWATYRDQWISEAFAEYSAMMFVETTVKGGDKLFAELLGVYDSILKGTLAGGFSRFNRPWLIVLNPTYRGRLGPISHGWRASTKEIPSGAVIQAYVRGPMVLHMLRSLLREETGSDDAFIGILRAFVREFTGRAASTDDFRAVVERATARDFAWFFDQWVHRAEIPNVAWTWATVPADDGVTLQIRMSQTGDEGDGFVLPIPVRIDLGPGRSETMLLDLDAREKTFEVTVPVHPAKVELNPGYAVLMTTSRR
jgi:hypothetical protein